MKSSVGNSYASSIIENRKHQENPILKNINSGIYKAITVGGKPDPEGRGRIAAYVPKLGGEPDNPMYFQYASPFGGANAQGSYENTFIENANGDISKNRLYLGFNISRAFSLKSSNSDNW